MKTKKVTGKMLFYESIASDFDSIVNMYDTKKRLEVVYDELVTENLKGAAVLDAGCGTGWFSQKAAERGAKVVAMDVGDGLLKEVKKKCKAKTVVGSILDIPFPKNTFDFVVSSEVVEHVTEPKKAITEIFRVLKPGGTLCITTPNRFWYFSVVIANALHLRPYQGLENWQSWQGFSTMLEEAGFEIKAKQGIHAFPFVLSFTHPLLDYLHRFSTGFWGKYMVNMAFKCQKPHRKKSKKS